MGIENGLNQMPKSSNTKEVEGVESADKINETLRDIDAGLKENADLTKEVDGILADEDISSGLKERLKEALTIVTSRVDAKFDEMFRRLGIVSAPVILNEIMIQIGNSPIEDGSILAHANKAVLGAMALYAAIKSGQFMINRYDLSKAEEGVDAGTIRGTLDGASTIAKHAGWVDQYIPVSKSELGEIYDEHHSVFVDAEQSVDQTKPGFVDELRRAYDRARAMVQAELSTVLTRS
jgi:hypothetical protein